MFSDPKHNIEQFMLGEGMKVAEFGAGSGHYVVAASRAVGESGRVYAIDIQKDLLGRIKSLASENGLSNVEVVWGDLEKLNGSKLRDESCDAGIAANVLSQVENSQTFADEVRRVIRKGGKLLVVDWSDSFGGLGPHPDNVVSEADTRSLFTERGFSAEKSIYAGEHHFGVVFRKLTE